MRDIFEQGLSENEAAERFKNEGPNEIPTSKRRGLVSIALEVAGEPMILLLLTASAVYFSLGDIKEALMLAVSVLLVLAITFYQEHKTERALEALRDLSSPRALVVRGGQSRRIPGREVVRGDLVLLKEGDRVPADGILVTSTHMAVDESLLTGESIPVRKRMADAGAPTPLEARPGGDDLPFVFSGSLVVQGQGAARATATGIRTEMGKIGKILQSVKPEKTRLQRETGRLVRIFATLGLGLCALTAVLYGYSRSSAVDGLLVGITMAMSMIPEEIPVVLTVFLALGAWRMSARNVLTRRIAAIETLGAATVLCVDKTGTLTQNRMTVELLHANGEFHDAAQDTATALAETFHELGEFALLASQRDPFDPMEKAIQELATRYLAGTEHIHRDWTLIREYPLTPALLALSHVWRSPGGSDFVIAAKGAPEAVLDLCHLDPKEESFLAKKVQEMAGRGLRVLAVAKAYFRKPSLPEIQHDFDFRPVGLLGFADPIRPSVPGAIRECADAGLRVVMITGDYAGTASHIADAIGLDATGGIVSGPELEQMSEHDLRERARGTNVYARTVPEQKLRLVEALKSNGETVAMTGDGVNDAPALKSAHIGVAMGGRGTDVAREASSIVLIDDDFSSIVAAVRMGRRIFDNLKKAVAYILSIHVPIAGLALLPVLLGWPLIFFPAHIVFLELIIDPACSIVFESEPEEKDIMRRPPRDRESPLFGRRLFALSALQGLGVLGVCFGVYVWGRSLGQPAETLRATTFTTLVAANLGLILTNRSWKSTIWATLRSPNRALWLVFAGAAAVLAAVLTIPVLRDLFYFAPLTVRRALLCVAAGFSSVLWFEFLKAMGKTGRT
ncbi:MAG TPA: cation-translocating P-type ATPase [bacterium]|nr:cation-translocating P-type ATPase [bacterium]